MEPREVIWFVVTVGSVTYAQSTHGLVYANEYQSRAHSVRFPSRSSCPQTPAPSFAVPTGAMDAAVLQKPPASGPYAQSWTAY